MILLCELLMRQIGVREVDVRVSIVLLAAVARYVVSPELDETSIHAFTLRDFSQGIDTIVDSAGQLSCRYYTLDVLLA